MRKRILAGLLTVALALSLLPMQTLASTGVAGVANVYTLADIKAATNDSSVNTIRLMNDIDVSKEKYRFDSCGQGDAPIYCYNRLRSDVVFEGNGHTIYNLKSGIWRYNYGTVRNLNISIHDTDTDSLHLSDFGRAVYTHQIEYFGITEVNKGTIENCNVTMRIDRKDQQSLYIGGIAQVNCGTIRDCIADLKVDVTATTGDLPGVWAGGIARSSSENSLIDHCLVLGHFNASGSKAHNISLSGIADLTTDTARCVDSAFAMDKAEVLCQDQYYFSPAFQTWTGSVAGAENCRVANDIPYQNIVTHDNPGNSNDPINEGGIFSGGPGYTLASRASILKDWDTSKVPAETPPTDTPVQSDPNVIPDDYVPIYTMADLKKCHGDYYLLMNDIDAAQEDIVYDGNGYNASSFAGRLFSGGVLNGNGHTIYNLRGPLFEYNMGTIRNLNVTLSNTDKDTDTFGAGKSLAGIALSNVNGAAEGLIENCTVTMTVDRTFGELAGSLSINGISSGGTIRNCIAKLNIYLDPGFGPEGSGTISISGIGSGNNNSLVDHCLVLGSIGIPNGLSTNKQPVHFNGISACTAQDSACALQRLVVHTRTARQDPYEYFTLSSGGTSLAGTGSICNRVANDMKVDYFFNDQSILGGTPNTKAGTYTLDTRANILKDWDLSVLPDPDALLKTDFTRGTVEFHFEGNCGDTRSWKFDYDDQYFYSQDDGYGYNAKLAKASLCLEMSAFSTSQNELWYEQLSKNDLRRAENISALYKSLGFETDSCQFVNYDVPLTDTSDKVAYSMAMKYITNEDGATDTLIAVPIRGGGYGGEWKSNFHVAKEFYSPWENHYGFDKPASDVLNSLSSYVANHEIKGDLKIWAVGYSRGAAVANLLGRKLNHAVLGGIKPNVCDIYVYTFATPAGATLASVDETIDPNIYNIVSPVDLVPHLAPSAWKYTRYGTTLLLPTDNTSKMWNTYSKISALEAPNKGFPASQRTAIDHFCDKAFTLYPSDSKLAVQYSVFDDILYLTIQQQVMDFAAKETSVPSSNFLKDLFSDETMRLLLGTAVVEHFPTAAGAFNNRDGIGNAHYPEHYLARLEADNLQSEDDFLNAVRSTRSVILYPSADKQLKTCDINVEFWKDSSSRAAGSSAGSYRNGVCTSGEVSVEMTDIGLIATFPAGADYTFTVSGADAGKLAMSIYAYDDMELDPARTMDFNSLPSTNGSPCTVYVPEDPYDEFYAEDANGKEYVPDSDSEYPDRVDSPAFTDVPADAYFYDAVEWAVAEGITSGTSPTTFSPNNGCTRAQMVTFLWRAAGSPEPESDYGPFRDVPKDAYYRKAVLWAAGEGITSGTSPTTFSPNAAVTRAQTVTFLWRWDGEPEADQRSGFRDVPTGQYYSEAVSWAVEAGITNGTGTTTFSPGQTCTRAQIVTFLWRDMA